MRIFEYIFLHLLTSLFLKYVHVRVDRIWFERLHYILLIGRGHRETLGGDREGIRKVIGTVIEMRWWIFAVGNT